MSAFVLTNEGVVVNRTEAQLGKVPLAAWDLGTFKESRFLSMQPDPALDVKQGDACSEEFEGDGRKIAFAEGEGFLSSKQAILSKLLSFRAVGALARAIGGSGYCKDISLNTWTSE